MDPSRRRAVAAAAALTLLATGCASAQQVRFASRTVRTVTERSETAPSAHRRPQQGGFLPPAHAARSGAATATTGRGTGSDASPSGGSKGTIKLGTVLPLEGGDRDWGEPVLRTTQAFIDEVNARGGVAGYQLQLVAYNACLTCQADALTDVRRLVEHDHVFAIVNTYVMVVAFQSVMPYLVQHGVPLIQGASEDQSSDALSPVNFVTLPPGQFYVRFLAEMAAKYRHLKRVGITYLDVPSEANGIPQIKAALERLGVQVVDEEPVQAEEQAVTNMDAVVARMRAAGAQGAVVTNPVVMVFGRLAAARQGWNGQWVGEAAWSQLVEQSCGSTCDTYVLTDTAGLSFTDRNSPQMRQFLDTMHRRYPGGSTTGHTLAAWVGMQLLTQVLGEVGRPDRAAFLDRLDHTTDLDLGTTAPLTFNPDRHMGASATELLRFVHGDYVRASGPVRPEGW